MLDAHPSNALTCQVDGGRDFYLFTNFGKSKLGVTNARYRSPCQPHCLTQRRGSAGHYSSKESFFSLPPITMPPHMVTTWSQLAFSSWLLLCGCKRELLPVCHFRSHCSGCHQTAPPPLPSTLLSPPPLPLLVAESVALPSRRS